MVVDRPDDTGGGDAEAAADYTTPAPTPPVAPGRRRRPPGLVLALMLAALAVVLAATWEGAIAPLMYTVRQHHQAADFAVGRKFIPDGDALAVVQIPAIGFNDVAVEGADVENLRGGPAHVSGTVLPGAAGTSIIVGKSSRYGGPFSRLGELKPGDEIVVKVRANPPVRFTVTGVERHGGPNPIDLDRSEPTLVLVTGQGGLFSSDVLEVTATAEHPAQTDRAVVATPPQHGAMADLSDRGNLVFNREALLGYLGVLALVLVVRFLHGRVKTPTLVAVLAPIVLLLFVAAALELDRILPPLR
jgi:LPXTG-site transpeptidase (sortase) family protein